MKVSLATQVLSHSVAAGLALYIKFGIFNDTAAGTAEFIERMNDVFDILNVSNFNSNKTYGREFRRTECQFDFLNKISEMLQSLKTIDCNDKDVTNTIKCFCGLRITIASTILLFSDLKSIGFKYLLTQNLNQDSIGNFFGAIRQQGSNSFNPPSMQFTRAFKMGMRIFSHSTSHNCESKQTNLNPISIG